MIDIRKIPSVIEMINVALSNGDTVEVKQEKDNIVVVGVSERRKLIGKVGMKSNRIEK